MKVVFSEELLRKVVELLHIHRLCRYGIEEIVYVSCNPKTLCINLDSFRSNGYEIKQIKAYDNFPMTKHIECVTLLRMRGTVEA